MKQSLQLRLGQQLTMTPQLQQAIRLLQLSTLELQLEVQQALESNVMLELAEEGEDEGTEATEALEALETGPSAPDTEAESYVESEAPDTELRHEAASAEHDLELQGSSDIPDELPVDSVWEDIYDNINSGGASSYDSDDRDYDYGDTSGETLQEHLNWQLRLMPMSDTDRAIAESIVDAVGDDGLLSVPLEELYESLREEFDIELDEVEAVLHAVQNLDPPGIAARDLRESLLLQLRQLPEDTPCLDTARQLLSEHFDLLANRDYNQLKRRLKLEEEELGQVIRLIQSLNPRPGSHISSTRTEYIVPDVIVRKVKGTWRVELNPEAAPRLRINATYAGMIKQVGNASDNTTLKNHLQEARWFIKSLQSRNETLLKVASCIVEHQREFLEQGEVAMKALVLHDIAQEVGMHESTISRVTTKKYMHTPRGIFELKYFFSSHVSTASGGECSSTAIRAFIKKMIAEENTAKPLSDSKIAEVLCKQGINVARRTVAKYREAMNIPPSNERKRLS
jgi:RNA polymerase sigma-54 factor